MIQLTTPLLEEGVELSVADWLQERNAYLDALKEQLDRAQLRMKPFHPRYTTQDYPGDNWSFEAHYSIMIKWRYTSICQCIQKLIEFTLTHTYPYLQLN